MTNKTIVLRNRPKGFPDKDTWELIETTLPELEKGEILIQQHYISLDPAMRGWLNNSKSYIPPVGIGDVMRSGSIGKVIDSKNPKIKKGTFLSGWGGVQQYTITNGEGWYPVDKKLAPLTTYIGTLGMPGMTAYFGILKVGKIKKGETVLVSGGAGAVGSVVGQIAKIKGCRVIGIAGGPEKCLYMRETLGYDGTIDYKNEYIKQAIKRECPKGIDVYFDNVGGEILDAALGQINMHARIVICGAISQYNNSIIKGPSNYLSLLVNRGTMQGMVVMDYAKDYGTAAKEMGKWMAQGKLKSKEDVYEGIENFYDTYCKLFSGEKLGKLVLKVLD